MAFNSVGVWNASSGSDPKCCSTGNGYPHVMQHGLGLLHHESGYGGSKMYSLGQDSYCDNTNSHTATNDHRHGSGSSAFCVTEIGTTTVNGFSIWVA